MTTISLSKQNVFGATMMVTGCCIGAGMIGLPIVSAAAGFLPSCVAMLIAYLFTTSTGLLLLEATLWFDGRVNLFTISNFALGRIGKYAVATLFLLLFYAIFIAYFDGGAQLCNLVLGPLFTGSLPKSAGHFLTLGAIASTLYCGARGVDRLNQFLLIGLALCYASIVTLGLSHVDANRLSHQNWSQSLSILPILFICFGYQNLVPSLTHYLQKQVSAIRFAIIVGNLIPMLFYALWNYTILGMIEPSTLSSEHGLIAEMLAKSGTSIPLLVQFFSFFALFTSFITVSFSFVDFLRDGFTKPPREFTLAALALIPPFAISLTFPELFLKALSFAGGFVDTILFGIIPVLIVWIGRYHKKAIGSYQMAGGKVGLSFLLLLSFLFLALRFV